MAMIKNFHIHPQPDDVTCGPTCLQAVYSHFGEESEIATLIKRVPRLAHGGTLAVFLGIDALKRGFDAKIYTYNLQMFDPTWFQTSTDLIAKLEAQAEFRKNKKLTLATKAYVEFLELGGKLQMEDLSPKLLRRYLKRGIPLMAGLSSTYLYKTMREYGPDDDDDDIRGEPNGHFVVLCGYDKETHEALVADPLQPNPAYDEPIYSVSIDRLTASILLGILTFDANLLIIEPKASGKHS